MSSKHLLSARFLTILVSTLVALNGVAPVAVAGPGLAPGYSAHAAPPPAPPDIISPTFYANSPLGLRPDLVGGPNAPMIDTGTAMRKFVDTLPSNPLLAPSTNAGLGTVQGAPKYIPLAISGTWPTDLSDYYHLAVVEYTEPMHSDLPKATTLRGYVQIEEPCVDATNLGSKHLALTYPGGAAITLPNAAGVACPVYAYDKPHYLGPAIVATKGRATRIKWSNLLPPGGATNVNGVITRNGDLPIPVDATLPGGALQQNRAAIHLHGGLSPWISDGTPHQWTVPVGETRFGFVNDIAVTAVGSGYTSVPSVTIDAPQSIATATATRTGQTVSSIAVTNAGSQYLAASPPVVTIAAPTGPPTNNSSAVATAVLGTLGNGTLGTVASFNWTNHGTAYSATPTVTIAAPTDTRIAAVPGTPTLSAAGNGRGSQLATVPLGTAGRGYTSIPTVTVGAPPAAVTATFTPTLNASGGVTALAVNGSNFGYWSAPTVTIAAPVTTPATATPTVSGTNGAISSLAVNNTNWGYTSAPTVTIPAPPTAVRAIATATLSGGVITAINLTNAGTNFGYWTAPTVTITGGNGAARANATVSNGRVTAINVTNGGATYTTATISVAVPTAGTQASATATVAGGKVTGYTLTGGSGYSPGSPPTITVAGPTGGSRATATATVANGKITAITMTAAGSSYNATSSLPTVTLSSAAASGTQAVVTVTGLSATGAVTGYTIGTAGSGYATAPTVTVATEPAPVQATATATLSGTTVASLSFVNHGRGYFSVPSVQILLSIVPVQATATANVNATGSVAGFTVTNPGNGYLVTPAVTVAPPTGVVPATASATVSNGALTGLALVNPGSGYTAVPNVTISGGGGTGATGAALIAMPYGPSWRQVPDMVGADLAANRPAGYTPPSIGEGTLYYTNDQSSRLMWYHDHTSALTRLNVYMGMVAPYFIRDPNVDPSLVGLPPPATPPATSLQGYVPGEIIPLVFQDKAFVPKDILQQDANWDTAHWGQYGDLWFPHVYETNQNPSQLYSASTAGRWDWGPWFAIVYPSMYALPSGKYGDATTTPEAFMDTAVVNGVAFPTVNVEPRAYRFMILNGSNDRFYNLGLYKADPNQVRAADGAINTEVLAGPNSGDQPGNYAGNTFGDNPLNAGLAPWPTDGRWAPLPSEMGPPMYQIGTEGGLLPHWVEVDPIPVNYDYNRRSVTVLNVSQNNDPTQPCYPECHGLYLGAAERADVVIDFSRFAGQTLIMYNDAPSPNPGFDPRIDYFTNNDPGNAGNYATGGAPNTEIGYGPNTRTMVQFVVGLTQNTASVDYTKAATVDPVTGFYVYDPTQLGAGRVVGQPTGTPGILQTAYAATQAPPIVGESAYNVAFNQGYTDQYGDMFLASQNEPLFLVTNPGALTLTGIAVTGQTTATGAASGIGLGGAAGGANANAGSGTGYSAAPGVLISPPTACTPPGTQNNPCAQAQATATVANGQVTSVALTNPGAGYTSIPSVTFIAGGAVAGLSLSNPGLGYAAAPTVTLAAPSGCALGSAGCTQATATASINALTGALTGLTITNPGAGYTTAPTVTLAAPTTVAAIGAVTALTAGSVAGVSISSGGVYPVGVTPTVTFSAPPPSRAAVIAATPFSGICCLYTVIDGGSGYDPATPPTITVVGVGGSGATAQVTAANIVNGSIRVPNGVTPTSIGSGFTFTSATATATAPTLSSTLASGTAVMDGAGHVTGVSFVGGSTGAGYLGVPIVTFSGGIAATGVAAVSGTGTGATAVALASTTQAFVVPAAMPNSGVPAVAGGVPVTSAPAALAQLHAANPVVGRLMNPAIQELFEPFYGRMNATLGIEMPNQSLQVQTTLPLNFVDPATEVIEPNTAQMWKITHNGVDAHPVHFHLVNVQVVNRVGWDGTIKAPEDNEIGWKETVKMNPLEDIIVVMKAAMPQVPFGIDRSIRPQDPSQPLGVNMGFTQFAITGINGNAPNGQPVPAGALGIGEPSPVVNAIEDYDNEYVWHCHILGHEENDFMRTFVATSQTVAPSAPASLTLTQASAGAPVVATWPDPTPVMSSYGNPRNELGFRLERATSANGPWTLVTTVGANVQTASDPLLSPVTPNTTVYYRVYGYNAPTIDANGAKVIGGTNYGIGAAVVSSLTVH